MIYKFYQVQIEGDGEWDYFVLYPNEDDEDEWFDIHDLNSAKKFADKNGGCVVEVSRKITYNPKKLKDML
jgi:hypothetical protein